MSYIGRDHCFWIIIQGAGGKWPPPLKETMSTHWNVTHNHYNIVNNMQQWEMLCVNEWSSLGYHNSAEDADTDTQKKAKWRWGGHGKIRLHACLQWHGPLATIQGNGVLDTTWNKSQTQRNWHWQVVNAPLHHQYTALTRLTHHFWGTPPNSQSN